MKKKYLFGFLVVLNLCLCSVGPLHIGRAALAQSSPGDVKLDVPFEPSATEVVDEMLSMAQVTNKDVVYDLGCGDGRVVITAAKRTGAAGVGVDLDPQRIRESVENAKKAGVADRVKFIRQDLFEADIRDATVVMLYLWPEVNLRLRPKLFRDLKPGTRIVSHSHDMGPWESDRTITAPNGHRVHFWVLPANVRGSWELQGTPFAGSRPWVLTLEQKYQKAGGALKSGAEQWPLKEGQVKGETVTFTVEMNAGGRPQTYRFTGTAKSHFLEGDVERVNFNGSSKTQWRAKRDPSTFIPIE